MHRLPFVLIPSPSVGINGTKRCDLQGKQNLQGFSVYCLNLEGAQEREVLYCFRQGRWDVRQALARSGEINSEPLRTVNVNRP